MKNYNNYLKETNNYLTDVDSDINVPELIKKIENNEIDIDFKMPDNDLRKEVKEWYKKAITRSLFTYIDRKRNITFLPLQLTDYDHPISGEYNTFLLCEVDGKLKITLGELDDTGWKEIETPQRIITGDFISTELDISSGKICFLGDNIRELFPEEDWNENNYKSSDSFRDNEKDAVKHIDYFSDKGYFFSADSYYITLSKKENEYHLYREKTYDDDEIENGEIIQEHLDIDSDHTLVVIDNDLLNDKLKKYDEEDYDEERYFKYCIDVEPGKYRIEFNWKRKIVDNILTYCKIYKV